MRFDRVFREVLDNDGCRHSTASSKRQCQDSNTVLGPCTLANTHTKMRIDCWPELSDSLTPSPVSEECRLQFDRDLSEKAPRQEPAAVLPWWLRVLSHTQNVMIVTTAVGVLYFRQAHALYYVATGLMTSFLAKALKRVIKQPRPPSSGVKTKSGMPSTHSAAVTFMGLYLAAALYLPSVQDVAAGRATSPPSAAAAILKWLAIICLLTLPPIVMHSRVRLAMHTPAQCVVGAVLGALCCAFFIRLWRHDVAHWRMVGQVDAILCPESSILTIIRW